jgi:DHA2 family multidrug resistance protein-like MFS transporter
MKLSDTRAPKTRAVPDRAQGPDKGGLVLLSLILVAAVANLDLSVANVELPAIGTAFDASQTALPCSRSLAPC